MTKPNDVNEAPVHGIVHTPKCWTCEGTGRNWGLRCYRCNGTGVFGMTQKPTPGPWKIMCDEARGRPRCLVVDNDGGEIAAINPHRTAWNENAGLMAESPQMLNVIEIIASATGDTDLEYAQELSQEILMRLKVV